MSERHFKNTFHRQEALSQRRLDLEERLEQTHADIAPSDVYADTLELVDVYTNLMHHGIVQPNELPYYVLQANTDGLATLTTSTQCNMADPNIYTLFQSLDNRYQRQMDLLQSDIVSHGPTMPPNRGH